MNPTANRQRFEESIHIRETLEYVAWFKNKVFTVAVDVNCFASCDQLTLIRDLMLLQACNIRLAVVIGNLRRPKRNQEKALIKQIDEAMRRITHLAYSMSNETIANFSGFYHCCENAINASGAQGKEMTLAVNGQLIEEQLKAGSIALIPCVTAEKDTSIPLTQAASAVAESVKAHKLIFLADYDGIYEPPKVLLRQVHPNEVAELIKNKHLTGTLIDISEAAIKAVQGGVRRAHIINGRKPCSLLLEVCSKDGVGTMIYRGPYREIRPARKKDIVGIIDLLSRYDQTGLVRQLSQTDLETKLQGFFVVAIDAEIIGCGCIQSFPEEEKGFVSSVAVEPGYIREGIGSQMLAGIEEHAKKSGVKLLTLVNPIWWLHQEFQQGCLEDLPEAVKAIYAKGGGHIFLAKRL